MGEEGRGDEGPYGFDCPKFAARIARSEPSMAPSLLKSAAAL